jgi:hypothetical protein
VASQTLEPLAPWESERLALAQAGVVQRLIVEKQRRLDHRKIQAARLGFSADPSILTEIEDLESEIADLNGQVVERTDASHSAIGQSLRVREPVPVVKRRRIDAAIPSQAAFGERVNLIAQVRFPGSRPLGRKDADWPMDTKPAGIEQSAEAVKLKFRADPSTGVLESTYLEIQIVAPDFTIEGAARQRLEVPPEEYSKRVVFLLTPRREGQLRVNVVIYDMVGNYLCTLPVQTEIVGFPIAAPTLVVASMLVVAVVPVLELAQRADATVNSNDLVASRGV